MEAAARMQIAFWRLHGMAWKLHAINVSSASDPTRLEFQQYLQDPSYGQKLDLYTQEFKVSLRDAEATSFTEAEKESVKKIKELFARYCNHLKTMASSKDPAAFFARANDPDRRQLILAIDDECKRLYDVNKKQVDESYAYRTKLLKYLDLIRYGSLIVGPLMGGFVGFWLARRLHHSVAQISVTLNDVVGKLEHNIGRVIIQPSTSLASLQQQVQTVAVRIQRVLDELQEARYQVLASERLAVAGELAAGVAHEIRNPLTSVKLLIQMTAQRSPDHSLGEKQLQVIQGEITRMEKTIQGLLDFAKPPQLHRITHDLRETVCRALSLVSAKAGHQNVAIFKQFSPNPQTIDGDPEQLHQVLINLLINGIEAMPNGGELRVEIGPDEHSPDMACVAITDSGPGIPPELFPRMFDPFVTTKKDGTGLGLAVSRRIIDEHAGTIDVVNQAQGGARFTIKLPVHTEG